MKDIKAIAFDLDGTIYLGDKIVEGALELLDFLKEKGVKLFYFTNSSRAKKSSVYYKLLKMGLDLNLEQVYTSTYATGIYLRQEGIKNVYCLGGIDLIEELIEQGINITSDNTEALVIGLYYDFCYSHLIEALNVILKYNCRIIACNRDRNFPVEGGKIMPGAGALVAAIEEICGRKIDYIVGKPNTYMIELLARDWGLSNNEILVVGDSIETDIEMAGRYKCPSVLISKDGTLKLNDTIVVDNLTMVKKLFE